MENKKCIKCGKLFDKPKGLGIKLWEKRKFCCAPCKYDYMRENKTGFQKGHSGYISKTSFSKGHKPWNKGKEIGRPDWLKFEHLEEFHGMNKGKKMSLSQRKKMSRARRGIPLYKNRGEKHWNWKGGTSKTLRKQIMQTNLYVLWRMSVYERSDWTCEICKQRGGKLQADHIKPFHKIISENKITSVQEAKMCVELWDVLNGRTLCIACHKQTETYGGIRKN